ncbi:hypothetical protein DFH09DRAFT_1311599 [Mycena vulgaris]|nr:hypothetical protein DFH09DRAFT_1311599 [Mycena vulgaris]
MLHPGVLECFKKPRVSLRIPEVEAIQWLLRGLALFAKPAPSIVLGIHDVSVTGSVNLVTVTGCADGSIGGPPSWDLHVLHHYPLSNRDISVLTRQLLPPIFQAHPMFAAHTLTLRNCTFGTEDSWVPILSRMTSLRTLIFKRTPSRRFSGHYWKTGPLAAWRGRSGSEPELPVCPALQHVVLHGIDCSAGRWLDMCRVFPWPAGTDTRFLELVIAYLEGRVVPLEVLEMKECLNFTATEVKLIRRLVKRVEWDEVGSFAATNPDRPI